MRDRVAVVISTYNGSKFLKSQLESIYFQSYLATGVIARDDKSSDDTSDILKLFNLDILDSVENLGAKKSFSKLLDYALQDKDIDYFMFCDQDDVWVKEKIAKTLNKMKELEAKNPDTPLLIHSDLSVVDENLSVIDDSFWNHEYINPQQNNFNRLLMQNTITGCTVMINRKLAQIALPIPNEAIMHDWWIGLVASKFGKIDFVDEALVSYRQHSDNNIGAKGFNSFEIYKKFYKIFYKNELYLEHLKSNLSQAEAFLRIYREKLDDKTVSMLEAFLEIDKKSFLQKRITLLKHGLLKQGFLRNLGLFLKI